MKIQLFIPCFIDQFYPQVARSTYVILKRAGCEIIYPFGQTCCGQPAYNSGYIHEAKKVCRHFSKQFNEDVPIVTPSCSCKYMISNQYKNLFKVEKPNFEIYELSEFLVHILKYDCSGSIFYKNAIIHNSCTALRECHLTQEIRTLLGQIKGLKIMPYENDLCCGFGGSFFVKFDSISRAMGRKKIETFEIEKPDCIISTDVSCFINLERVLKEKNSTIKLYHLAEVINNVAS